jgi:hypothetical protein
MLDEIFIRALAFLIGSIIGAAFAKYLGYEVGPIFQFGTEGWAWQSGLITVGFALFVGELTIKFFKFEKHT